MFFDNYNSLPDQIFNFAHTYDYTKLFFYLEIKKCTYPKY